MRAIVVLEATVLLAGCSSLSGNRGVWADVSGATAENYFGYLPVDPTPAESVTLYNSTTNKMETRLWASLCEDVPLVRRNLPLQSAQVAVSTVDLSGKLSYLSASVSGQLGTYEVVMDYMKYRVEDVRDENTDELLGNARIGVGLRIKAVVRTKKVGLDLSSLMAIGLQAQAGTLQGGISVDVIGIDSNDVVNLIPLTSEINQTSIQGALQALASIKAKMCDNGTILTPHVVAVRQEEPQAAGRIKEQTSVGRARGEERVRRMQSILAAVAPAQFDPKRWAALVTASSLPDKDKAQLGQMTNVEAVEARLNVDAGTNGRIITALYESLSAVTPSSTGGQPQ